MKCLLSSMSQKKKSKHFLQPEKSALKIKKRKTLITPIIYYLRMENVNTYGYLNRRDHKSGALDSS